MADDAEEQEFQIEGQTLQSSPVSSSSSPLPPEEDAGKEAQRKLDLQKVADDKLLTDADIAVDGMSEEEKRQILWALRESMPAVAPPSPEAHTPSSSSLSPDLRDVASNDGKDVKEEEKERKEAEDNAVQSIEDAASEESNDRVCDSSTSAALTKTSSTRVKKTRQSDADSASESEKLDVGLPRRRTRGQQKKCAESGSGGDVCSNTSEKSEEEEGIQADLTTRSLRKLKSGQGDSMKLSTRQKELSQTRFKDLFNKTNLSLSQQSAGSQVSHLSPIKEGVGSPSSQDLFADHLSEEVVLSQPQTQQTMSDESDSNLSDVVTKAASPDSASVTSPSKKKPRKEDDTPSPIQVLTEDSSSCDNQVVESMKSVPQSQVMDVDDGETQPPEDVLMVQDEDDEMGKGAEAGADTDEEDGRVSPVYPAQVPQASCSSPQSQSHDRLTAGISPAKLGSISDKDKRPLLHDNWFSWPHIPPICQLQRRYRSLPRKKKETPHDSMPYCCPELASPVQISNEMLKVFDAYFPYFTSMQHCFKQLPWGKPVRAGFHLPDTLDLRKRGERAFCLDEDDLDDTENGQPLLKKVISADGPTKRNSCLRPNIRVSTRQRTETENEENMDADLGNAGDSLPGRAKLYEAETQPYDTDEDLPDIQITTSTVDNVSSRGREEEITPSLSQRGSQSSNSMLNEQGELYSTQLPHRKRRAETRPQETTNRADRPKRHCTQSVHSSSQPEQDVGCNLEQQLPSLSRKRKQTAVSPTSEKPEADIHVSVDDDDDDNEISFPRRKKMNTEVSERGYVHISSAKGGDYPSVSSVMQSSGLQRRNRSGGQHPVKAVSDMGDFKQVKRKVPGLLANIHQGQCGAEDSDDSVQFVDPASTVETAIVEEKVTETATIEKRMIEVGTMERRVTETVEKKVTETKERRIVVHPQTSSGAGTFDDDVGVASASHSQPVMETEGEEVAQTVACPLCNLEFPRNVIEQHASDCTGEVVELEVQEAPLLRSAFTSNQLKRRPLHNEIQRQEFVCDICQMNLGESAALKQHFEKCWQQKEASSTSADPPAPPRGGGRTVSSRSSENWLDDYHIPRKGKSISKGRKQDVKSTVIEEPEEEIEECSDDSSKDPDFAPTKDDKRQEKEDAREDEGLDEEKDQGASNFKPISKLTNNPIDFHNKFTRKPRKKPAKSKDRQS